MTCMFGVMMTNRLWQVRYVAGMIMLMLISYFLFPAKRQHDPKSTSVVFLHLLTFAAHFGAQCWVTFIAGLTMFYNLPRIMFGQVQRRLFPMYFVTTLVLSSVTLVTYTIRHPYETWSSSDRKQVMILATCVLSTFINSFFLAPEIVAGMETVFEMEKDSGIAYAVGYVDKTELKKNPVYNYHYRKFRLHHSISGIANVITLICNTVYLYHLACLCVYLNLNQSLCI